MALINGQTIAEAINDPDSELARLVTREPDDSKLVDELFFRILNRPATPDEIKECIPMLKAPAEDHAKLLAVLKAREAEVAPLRVKQELEREAAIERAKAELAAHEKAIAPKVAEAEKQRAERIAAGSGGAQEARSISPGWARRLGETAADQRRVGRAQADRAPGVQPGEADPARRRLGLSSRARMASATTPSRRRPS